MTSQVVLKKVVYTIDFSGYRIKSQVVTSKLAFKEAIKKMIERGSFKDCSPKLRVSAEALHLDLVMDARLVDKTRRDLNLIGKPYGLLGVKTSFEVVD